MSLQFCFANHQQVIAVSFDNDLAGSLLAGNNVDSSRQIDATLAL